MNPQAPVQQPVPAPPPTPVAPKPPPVHRPSILINLLLLLLGIIIGAGGFWGYQNLIQKPTPTPIPTVEPTPTATPDPTADWETYTNSKFGFSLKYPPELKPIESKDISFVNVNDDKNQYMLITKNFIGGWMGKEYSKDKINIDGEEGTISLWLTCENWETTKCLTSVNLENYDSASLKVIFIHGADKWYIFGPSWKNGETDNATESKKLDQILSTFQFTE